MQATTICLSAMTTMPMTTTVANKTKMLLLRPSPGLCQFQQFQQPAAAQSTSRPASYIRAFFVREQLGEGDAAKTVFRCKLKPDEVGQDHPPTIAAGQGELKSMKRHFESSNFHKKAHEYFVQLVSGGMAEDTAIKAVVSRFSPPAGGDIVGPMDAFTKRAKHSASANSLTVQRELAFVCFTIIAGVSFRSAENPYLLAYHEKSNNAEAPPSRKRISNVLLPLPDFWDGP
jgi:hypothetical protein